MDSNAARWPSPWWARREPAEPASSRHCEADGCSGPPPGPFAIYCPHCGGLIWLSAQRHVQMFVVNAARFLVASLIVLAVSVHSPIPAYVALGLISTALLVMPLHAFKIARVAVAATSIAFLAIVAATHHLDRPDLGNAVLLALVAMLPVLGVLAALAVDARFIRCHPEARGPLAELLVAIWLVAAPTVLFVVLVYDKVLSDPLGTSAPEGMVSVAPLVSLAMLCGALTVAATSSLVRGARRSNRPIEPMIRFLSDFKAPQMPMPDPPQRPPLGPRDFAARVAFVASSFAIGVTRVAMKALQTTLNVIWGAARVVTSTAVRSLNMVHSLLVRGQRLLVATTADLLNVIAGAVAFAVGAVWRSLQSSATTGAALAGSALLTVAAAEQFTIYLDDGGFDRGVLGWLALLVALALLAVTWWSITRRPAKEVGEAADQLIASAGPNAFFATVFSAWVIGILGWAGISPIQPGVFTVIGTAVLTAVIVSQYVSPGAGPLSRLRSALQASVAAARAR